MNILSIDTSGKTASCAVTNGHLTVGEFNICPKAGYTHSEVLLPMIDGMFLNMGMDIGEMDYIACVNGPGSFTGLRIGASLAIGFSTGLSIPLVPVSTLDAMAYNIIGSDADTYIVPMMDARRSQIYTAIYHTKGCGPFPVRVTDYLALSVSELMHELGSYVNSTKGRAIFTGDGASEYMGLIGEEMINNNYEWGHVFAPQNGNRQRAASAGVYAYQVIKSGTQVQPFALSYIRKPQAQRELEGS